MSFFLRVAYPWSINCLVITPRAIRLRSRLSDHAVAPFVRKLSCPVRARIVQTIRVSLFARTTPTLLRWVRYSRLMSHRPRSCSSRLRWRKHDRAPWMISLTTYPFPHLLIPNYVCLPPVECSAGISPSHAAMSRARLNCLAVAIIAVAPKGPIPDVNRHSKVTLYQRLKGGQTQRSMLINPQNRGLIACLSTVVSTGGLNRWPQHFSL